jgi:hypothetical protein
MLLVEEGLDKLDFVLPLQRKHGPCAKLKFTYDFIAFSIIWRFVEHLSKTLRLILTLIESMQTLSREKTGEVILKISNSVV